jgi:hypothetical protein
MEHFRAPPIFRLQAHPGLRRRLTTLRSLPHSQNHAAFKSNLTDVFRHRSGDRLLATTTCLEPPSNRLKSGGGKMTSSTNSLPGVLPGVLLYPVLRRLYTGRVKIVRPSRY